MRGKGAQIRALAPFLVIIWDKFCSAENINHRRISFIFKLDAEIEQILDNHKPVNGYYTLGAQLGAVARQKQIQLSQLYIMLEESYAEEPRPLFNAVSKLHYPAHIMDTAAALHPHLNWCWKGEDFMHVTSVLMSSCLRGRQDVSATIKAIGKYRLVIFLAWK
jgi:hypothetical protein